MEISSFLSSTPFFTGSAIGATYPGSYVLSVLLQPFPTLSVLVALQMAHSLSVKSSFRISSIFYKNLDTNTLFLQLHGAQL